MRIEITAVPSVADGAGHRYSTGQIVDVNDDLARAWVDAGHARRASAKSETKRTATRKPPTTATPKARPKPKPKAQDDGGQSSDGDQGDTEPPGTGE